MVWGEKGWGAAGGAAGTVRPSNLGRGAAAGTLASTRPVSRAKRTPECQLRRGVSASLVVSDESQDLAEAGHGQQTAVLRVCNLPYLAQHGRGQLGALEELDGDLARYDAELLCVGLVEEVLEHALLLGRQVEDGLVYARLAVVMAVPSSCVDALSSPLPERSAMAASCARCQTGELVDGERAPAMRPKLSRLCRAMRGRGSWRWERLAAEMERLAATARHSGNEHVHEWAAP